MVLSAMTMATSFVKPEGIKEDKSMESLWKEYDNAEGTDRVRKMAQILEEIKEKALKERSAWDYYKACDRYVDVVSMRNWKLRDSLETVMKDEIRAYDEPLLTYLLDSDHSDSEHLVSKVKASSERLEARHNPEVYAGRGEILNPAVVPYVRDDYEYVLWDLFRRLMHGKRELAEDVYVMLQKKSGDVYPLSPLAEYFRIVNMCPDEEREKLLTDLSVKYEGRAVSLLPSLKLVGMEFNEKTETGTSDYFKDLKKRLESYEHERHMYRTGADGVIAKDCKGFASLLEHLESKSLKIKVEGGKACLSLRNLPDVTVRIIRDDETVHEARVDNPYESFYAYDKVGMDLPDLDDGDYAIVCSSGRETLGKCRYPKFTLSAAVRSDRDGIGVYVADYLSGKPLKAVDMELYKGNRKVVEVSDVILDGYTSLPEEIASKVGKGTSGYYLVCLVKEAGGRIRRSDEIYLSRNDDSGAHTSRLSAVIMPERSAFRPGESVRFKAVVYESSSDGKMEVSPARAVSLKLQDPQGNVLETLHRRTDGFGSVAGEFSLDGIRRNGTHTIQVWYDDRQIGSVSVTVDEFVLPTFNVTFDKPEKTFLPGDTLLVSGKLESFSGHPLSSASVTAAVSYEGKSIMEAALEVDRDGRFVLQFADVGKDEDRYSQYDVEIKVTDLTGETLSFSCRRSVMRWAYLNVSLVNGAEGRCRIAEEDGGPCCILTDETARIACNASYPGGEVAAGVPLSYVLKKDGKIVRKGVVDSGDEVEVDFGGLSSGIYSFVLTMSLTAPNGVSVTSEQKLSIVRIREGEAVPEGLENVFTVVSEDEPFVRIGVGRGPVWAVVELFDGTGRRLHADLLELKAGESRDVRYAPVNETADAVIMNILYFRNSECHAFSHVWHRRSDRQDMPLEIVKLTDECLPGAACSLTVRTDPAAEVLVAVFDVATEQIRKNVWRNVLPMTPSVFRIQVSNAAGRDGSGYESVMGEAYYISDAFHSMNGAVVGYGSLMRSRRTKTVGVVAESEGSMDFVTVEESVSDAASQESSMPEMEFRENFSESLAFEPFLHPDDDGNVTIEFNASDKISTFVVSVFAHDKNMGNAVVRRDILVTMPVKLDVMQPQYLYSGDRYVLAASVSNNSAHDVCGEVDLRLSDGTAEGDEVVLSCVKEVKVPAGKAVPVSFDVEVPAEVGELGFRVSFRGHHEPAGTDVSDGIGFSVPVHSAEQVLMEAHSGVLLGGMSEDRLVGELRKRFVNVSSAGAEYSAVSIRDMLKDALPLVVEADGKDAISQSEAMYVNMLAAGLRVSDGMDVREYVEAAMKAAGNILACADPDGGFSWFEGMKPSPVVTAVVLERFAGLRDRGLLALVSDQLGEDALDDFDAAVTDAVLYLDEMCFNDTERPLWYGRISQWQYMSVRSMYAGVPFDLSAARRADGGKTYRDFRTAAKDLLVPKKRERWTDGAVLSKVRMISILHRLTSSQQGMGLAAAWGLPAGSGKRMLKSMKTELESLKEYAVSHPSGGIYYPNAVLPWRGLLESEAYAHSMICDLYDCLASGPESEEGLNELAEGIRIWMMLQKETQEWSSDPGFVEALASVYDGSDEVMDTKVIVLSKRYARHFGDIKPAGNGFRLEVSYYRDGQLLKEGDVLHKGDKVMARYSVWSEENRSFVRLSVPRAACFRPAEQLSGWSGGWLRPLTYGSYAVAPYSYREVKADRTLYWMDVCPEENSTVEEALFVVQEGCFSSPVAEIESLYAAHYRANEGSWDSFEAR